MKEKVLTHDRFVAMFGAVGGEMHVKFLKYLVVGVLNTLIAYILFAALLYSGLHYSLAALFVYFLGVLASFKTFGRLVFKSRDNRHIFRFASVYVFLFVLNIGCLRAFTLISFNLYVGSLLLTIPFAIISFLLNSRYVFQSKVIESKS